MTDKILSAVLLTATATAFCASCSTDELAEQQQGETKTVSLTATLGETPTRAGINSRSDNTHTLYWHDSDQILVRTKSTSDGSYSGVQFDIAPGTATGVTSATFKGTVNGNAQIDTYAVYPYNENHEFKDDNTLTFNLPSEYNYDTVESGIFPKNGAYRTTNTHVPMIGTIVDGTAQFKHLGALLVIRIDKMPAESGNIMVSADQRLTGNFTVDLSVATPEIATEEVDAANNTVRFTYSNATKGGGVDYVNFTYSNATKGGVGVFYLPIPTGSYTNLRVAMYDDGASALLVAKYGSLNVDRADIIAIPVYQGSDGTSYSCDYVVNGHKFIDLCLPSGTLWAETNVGATNAADYGNYYAWGETETKSNYHNSYNNYKYYDTENNVFTKYPNSDDVLESEDDAAYMNWGSFCKTPTYGNFGELGSNCTWEWTTQPNSSNQDTYGCLFTSKKNGKTVFFPAAGYKDCTSTHWTGGGGCYWSTLYSQDKRSYRFLLQNNEVSITDSDYRYRGLPIRPVAKTYGSELEDATGLTPMDKNDFDDSWK